jgi:hypothetical protein
VHSPGRPFNFEELLVMKVLMPIITEIQKKRHHRLRETNENPLLTVLLSPRGYNQLRKEIYWNNPRKFDSVVKDKTIAGCLFTIMRNQVESFRVIER